MNHDSVVHGTEFLQLADHARDGGILLAHGDVDALNAGPLLVDDGVNRDGGLAGLTVADNQLTLAAADGHHGVDGLDSRLHRLVDRFARDDAGGDLFQG